VTPAGGDGAGRADGPAGPRFPEGSDAGEPTGDDGRPVELRCSVASRAAEEPVEATAPHAVSWVGVVVPGSWPRDALSRLPERLRDVLDDAPGVRAVLLRPVGRATSDVGLVLAGTVPGRTWLREVAAEGAADAVDVLTDPGHEALDRLVTGRDPGLGRSVARPAVLVCTNGARDACCARQGRPAAVLVRDGLGVGGSRLVGRSKARASVWESSHLGGHRFAPTAAVLPHGVLLGGLGPDPAPLERAVSDLLAGRTVLDGYRGRSTYRAPEQAAETAVRRHLAVIGANAGPDDVRVDGSEAVVTDEPTVPGAGEARRVFVRHTGGRTFRVVVRRFESELRRPASCGAEPTPVVVWETEVDADTAPGIYISG
jgi:hypothetical protein